MSYTTSPPFDLKLKPSELPPGCTAPLCAPADGRLVLKGKVILLRLVRLRAGEFVLYARWDGRNTLVLRSGAPQIWKGKPTPQKLRRVAENLESNNSWSFAAVESRMSSHGEGTSIALIRGLHPVGVRSQDYAWVRADLADPIAFEIEADPRKTTAENLQSALSLPDSFARFAHQWNCANAIQRAQIWQSQIERREEAEQLMKYVVWCIPEVWEQSDKFQLCSMQAYEANQWFFLAQKRPYNFPQLSSQSSEFALKWGQIWQTHFLPIHALSLQQCNYKLGFSMGTLGASIKAPTAHEQLEARLSLRSWLQHNAPDQLNELSPT